MVVVNHRFYYKGKETAVWSNFLPREFKLDLVSGVTGIQTSRMHGVVTKSLFALIQTFVKNKKCKITYTNRQINKFA